MALKIRVRKAPTKTGDCGGAENQVRWVLDAADNGWVIQQIDWNHDVLNCDDTVDADLSGAKTCAKADTPRFWEAWRVVAGKVFIGNTGDAHGADTYLMLDHPRRKRKHSITGKVQFIAGYTLTIGTGADDWQEGDIPAAGSLPTRKTVPTGFDAGTARDHNLAAEWDCCATPPATPTITGTPETSDPGSGERVKPKVRYEVSLPGRRVASLLNSGPSWIAVGEDKKAQSKLLSNLRRISRYPPDVIRGGAEYFIEEAKRKKSYSLDDQSKLYLLNRYVFKLPRFVFRGQLPFFGGWLLPNLGERFDPSWPFAIRKGQLVLKGIFSGYMGDEFRALAEFDYFRGHFKRRKAGKG